jgi:hypothetical protein
MVPNAMADACFEFEVVAVGGDGIYILYRDWGLSKVVELLANALGMADGNPKSDLGRHRHGQPITTGARRARCTAALRLQAGVRRKQDTGVKACKWLEQQ